VTVSTAEYNTTDRPQSRLTRVTQFASSHAQLFVVSAVLCLSVGIVFGASVGYGFVNWDDPWYVTNNRLIQSWSFENLYGIATETVSRNYAPVTVFSYLIDYTLWGDRAGGYHLTNLLWHSLNAVLVFTLIRQLTSKPGWAMAVALLFAIHPVQIESVVWISARKGLIFTAFMLGSLCFWLRENRSSRDELIGLGLFVVALFAKATAVVLPAIVFMYDWLIRKKTFAEAISRQVIGLLLAIWFTLLTTGSQKIIGGGVRHHFALNKLEILGMDAVLLWRYLGMLLFPFERSILYDPPVHYSISLTLFSVLFWTALSFWLIRQRHQRPLLVFAFAATLLLLLPMLNLIPLTTIINDRYLYLSCVPLFGIAVAGVGQLLRLLPTLPARSIAIAGLTFLLLGCGWLSRQQMTMWNNDLALWTQAVKVSPELPVARYQYALALWEADQKNHAIAELQQTLALPRIDSYDRERFTAKLDEFQHALADQRTQTAGVDSRPL